MADQAESLFLRQRKRERDLIRRPGAHELTEIVGVVHPRGTGGAHAPGDTHWRLSFALLAWRRPGDPIQLRTLDVVKPATEAEVQTAMKSLLPYDVVRLRVRLADPGPEDEPVALLVQSLGSDPDEEMTRTAEALQRPVTFQHHAFGEFTLDRRTNWYEARIPWGTETITLSLSMDWRVSLDDQLQRAAALAAQREAWYPRLVAFAVADLLSTKNTAWLDEGQPPLDADEFARALKPEAIVVEHDGSIDFWFEDGDLFWGHGILVQCSPDGEPTHVELAG